MLDPSWPEKCYKKNPASELVFCYHNCSDLLWEKNLFQCDFKFLHGTEANKSESRKVIANSRPKAAKNL